MNKTEILIVAILRDLLINSHDAVNCEVSDYGTEKRLTTPNWIFDFSPEGYKKNIISDISSVDHARVICDGTIKVKSIGNNFFLLETLLDELKKIAPKNNSISLEVIWSSDGKTIVDVKRLDNSKLSYIHPDDKPEKSWTYEDGAGLRFLDAKQVVYLPYLYETIYEPKKDYRRDKNDILWYLQKIKNEEPELLEPYCGDCSDKIHLFFTTQYELKKYDKKRDLRWGHVLGEFGIIVDTGTEQPLFAMIGKSFDNANISKGVEYDRILEAIKKVYEENSIGTIIKKLSAARVSTKMITRDGQAVFANSLYYSREPMNRCLLLEDVDHASWDLKKFKRSDLELLLEDTYVSTSAFLTEFKERLKTVKELPNISFEYGSYAVTLLNIIETPTLLLEVVDANGKKFTINFNHLDDHVKHEIFDGMLKKRMDKTLNVKVDSELLDEFKKYCDGKGYNFSKKVRELMENELNGKEESHILQKFKKYCKENGYDFETKLIKVIEDNIRKYS